MTETTQPTQAKRLHNWISAMPKVETHVHLEGSIHPDTLLELAMKHKMESCRLEPADIRRRYRYDDFREFIRIYLWVVSHLRGPDDYALIARRFCEKYRKMNATRVEVTLSAGMMLERRLDPAAIMRAVQPVFEEFRADGGPSYGFIFDITRQFGPDNGQRILDSAIECMPYGVMAVGLGGDEVAGPARLFGEVYARAREAGLNCVAHAGEWAGPESVRDAVEILQAVRIGHGVAAREDEGLMEMLAQRGVTIECCPTSNVKTGSIERLEEHPLRTFLDRGLRVGIHSDDPPLFHTDLIGELWIAVRKLGLGVDEIIACQRNAIGGALAEDEEKRRLESRLSDWLAANPIPEAPDESEQASDET